MREKLEQVKVMGDIIAPGEIKVDKYDQLWELYIIKLKCGICMFETNEKKIRGQKYHIYLKT